VRQALLVLFAAVGVVLLIACANVASLLLARASTRARELSIRAALGATRGALVRQLLGESLVLAMAGGGLGLLIGVWAVRGLVLILPEGVPRAEEIGLDLRVAATCFMVALLSALVFGLVPALQASRADAAIALRDSGDRASTAGRGRARTRSALVVVELALTLVLLVSAGLLANSFLRLQSTDPGFATSGVSLLQLPLPQSKYSDGKAQSAFYQRLLEGLATRGEIEMAAVAFPDPLAGANASGSFSIEGRPESNRGEQPRANLAGISPAYLRVMGIALISGRHFTEQDRDPAPTPIIVNAAFARRYWPGENALGKRLRFDEEKDEWLTVVGVAADSRNRGLDTDPQPLMYLPYHAFALPFMSVVARSPGGPGAVASAVRAEVRRIDPDLPVDKARPVDDIVRDSVAEPRFRATLLALFAAAALVLATIGVYGLISYSVAQRTREIGIRVALGAQADQVIWPIVREGMTLALVGVGLGLTGALAATKILAAFLYGIEATDPLTFGAVALLLLVVALAASYIPSRRALKVDPLTALRT
jgi:putative ABC transport system permease protein